jgi:hypothetical protein
MCKGGTSRAWWVAETNRVSAKRRVSRIEGVTMLETSVRRRCSTLERICVLVVVVKRDVGGCLLLADRDQVSLISNIALLCSLALGRCLPPSLVADDLRLQGSWEIQANSVSCRQRQLGSFHSHFQGNRSSR